MKLNKYLLGLASSVMLFASCADNDLDLGDSTTPALDPNCPSVEFSASNPTTVELDPSAAQFDVKVVRRATDAASYAITADDADGAYDVPATVAFGAGEKEATITIATKAGAEAGVPHKLTLTFDEAALNPYTTGAKIYTVNATVIKWDKIGTGYWLGHLVNEFFGVDTQPLAVELEKAVTKTATKYRFASPYASVSTGDDGLGYIGYPYNGEGDLTGNGGTFVITVTKDGASLEPLNLGINYGYGEFSVGSVYGYLSDNAEKYPLGVFATSETGGVITFDPGSLYVSMSEYNDGGKYPCGGASVLYLSKDDFLAASEE